LQKKLEYAAFYMVCMSCLLMTPLTIGVSMENVLNAEFLFSYYQNFFLISNAKSRFKAL